MLEHRSGWPVRWPYALSPRVFLMASDMNRFSSLCRLPSIFRGFPKIEQGEKIGYHYSSISTGISIVSSFRGMGI